MRWFQAESGTRKASMKVRLLCGAIVVAVPLSGASAQTTPESEVEPESRNQESEQAPEGSTATEPEGSDSSIETVRTTEGNIIVTARRYVPGEAFANKSNIPLIETPQSVSVVTRDQIDLLNFVDVQQAVRYTAGTQGEHYGPDLRFDFLTVRGFTPRQYIDGLIVPVSTTIPSAGLDLYLFDSLEILKGPASMLYGSAPPGGIFNETSRRPLRSMGGEIQAKFGNDDYKSIAGTITGNIAGPIDARLTGLYLDRDAERDLVTAKRLSLAPSLTVRLTDATSLTGLFYYQKDKVRNDTNGFLPAVGTLLPNPNGQLDRDANVA